MQPHSGFLWCQCQLCVSVGVGSSAYPAQGKCYKNIRHCLHSKSARENSTKFLVLFIIELQLMVMIEFHINVPVSPFQKTS